MYIYSYSYNHDYELNIVIVTTTNMNRPFITITAPHYNGAVDHNKNIMRKPWFWGFHPIIANLIFNINPKHFVCTLHMSL